MQSAGRTLNPFYMKTVIKILAGLFLLAVMYFIAADGMMVHFGLKQSVQYAFNFGAIVVLIPLCIHFLFPFEEAKS
jgi:hypothetical protein